MDEKLYLSGYISVYTAIIAGNRRIFKVLIDRERFDKVMKSKYHFPEKKQYSLLKKQCDRLHIPASFVKAEAYPNAFVGESGGIAAEVGERLYNSVEELLEMKKPFLCAIDGIEDPYNFGQVLRSFYASGVDGVIVPKRNFFNAASVVTRASAGASELLNVAVTDDMEGFCQKAKEKGVALVATAAEKGAKDLFKTDFSRPLCVFLGGERRGMSKKLMELCDMTVEITYPRNSAMALSASSAAAVVAFEIGRRLN
ncbi:MAG: RNA methyltransferase [Ruminococcaceae bacterium]|nr:RNA methyltransferase [Oscillospiraceae bacterium]